MVGKVTISLTSIHIMAVHAWNIEKSSLYLLEWNKGTETDLPQSWRDHCVPVNKISSYSSRKQGMSLLKAPPLIARRGDFNRAVIIHFFSTFISHSPLQQVKLFVNSPLQQGVHCLSSEQIKI